MSGRCISASFGASPLGAWFAGALFAFQTYSVNEQPRPHVLFHALLPVALVHLIRLLQGGPRRHAWIIGVTLAIQSFFENYVVVFALVLLSLTYVLFLLFAPRDTLRRTGALILPAILCALVALPMLLAYSKMDRIYDYSHYYVHHFVPKTKIGKRVREHHMRHHFQDHRYGYGVSSPFWDYIFRTVPRSRKSDDA